MDGLDFYCAFLQDLEIVDIVYLKVKGVDASVGAAGMDLVVLVYEDFALETIFEAEASVSVSNKENDLLNRKESDHEIHKAEIDHMDVKILDYLVF